ncbi:MAG TPA: hypothetical protein VFB59_01365 [Candidatus Saccharimonadales bacterium]|nr:hypothetical protein [Candidatus Saccharimonadales bacterium]
MKFTNSEEQAAYRRLLSNIESLRKAFGDRVIMRDSGGKVLYGWLRDLEDRGLIDIVRTPIIAWNPDNPDHDYNDSYVFLVFDNFFEYAAAELGNRPIKANTPHSKQPEHTPNTQEKVVFDAHASTLSYGGIECDIPDEKLEYYVCKLAFKNRRIAAKETDILSAANKELAGNRAIYDAVRRINQKAKDGLNIQNLLSFKAGKVRVNKNFQ